MFDIGFWELFLLFVLGLLVLGPERLPRVARTLGMWAGRARGYVRQLSNELDRELQTEELRRQFKEANKAVQTSVNEFQSLTSKNSQQPATTSTEKPSAEAQKDLFENKKKDDVSGEEL